MHQAPALLRAITYLLCFVFLAIAAIVAPTGNADAAVWAPAVRYPLAANVLALGNANVSNVAGAAAVLTNPAGLAWAMPGEAQVTHLRLPWDANLDGVAVMFPGLLHGWGIAAQQLVSKGLTQTNHVGEEIGNYDYMEGALVLAGGMRFRQTNAGLALRGLWQGLAETKKSGVELKAGVQQRLAPGWDAGLALSILRQPQAEAAQESLAASVQYGVSYGNSTLSMHVSAVSQRSMAAIAYRPLAGVELRVAAENSRGDVSYRMGIGLQGRGAALDYAYLGGGQGALPEQLALGHVVSVRFSL